MCDNCAGISDAKFRWSESTQIRTASEILFLVHCIEFRLYRVYFSICFHKALVILDLSEQFCSISKFVVLVLPRPQEVTV